MSHGWGCLGSLISWVDPEFGGVRFIFVIFLHEIHLIQFGVTTLDEGLHFDRFWPQTLALHLFVANERPLSLLHNLLSPSGVGDLVGTARTSKCDGTHGMAATFTADHTSQRSNFLFGFFPLSL